MSKFKPKYKAAMYLRLSRDDGDKPESDSISNQRSLIIDYASKLDDVEIVCEKVDDGYSGSNFDRPGFTSLLQSIKKNEVNCVIVKDLSRFSRDYIGSGMYVMNLFPKWGIRIIAISDNYDSVKPLTANDELLLSFKSIMNDIYLRDISTKIRSNLEVKRKNGEYIGPFVVYGYLKSADDKHKIIVDEQIAPIIQNIFNRKLDGMSPDAIADKLNAFGILSPAEYKKKCGSKHNGFKSNTGTAKWSSVTVRRILVNPIYTGTLIQGKKTTVSHKVKKIIDRDKANWAVLEEAHPAIISKQTFDIVQNMLARDTRNASKNAECNVFSGMLFCQDCKEAMIRQTYRYKTVSYVYYRCGTQKNTGACFNHNIREDVLKEIILSSINAHIRAVISLEKTINLMDKSDLTRNNHNKIERLIREKEAEISKRKKDIFFTHQSYADGIITEDEFKEFKAIYDMQISDAEHSIERLRQEQDNFKDNIWSMCSWMKDFKECGIVKKLSHKLLILLVDKIIIGGDKNVTIVFRYQNEFERLSKITESMCNQNQLMECAG